MPDPSAGFDLPVETNDFLNAYLNSHPEDREARGESLTR